MQNTSKKVFTLQSQVYSDLTNAEGNMTHYEYVRLFSRAMEEFVKPRLLIQTVPYAMSFKYIKDVLPGQIVEIRLWLHESTDETAIFLAEFINPDNEMLHAVAVQKMVVEKPNHGITVQSHTSKAVGQLNKLCKWLDSKKLDSKYTNFIFNHKVRIDFGRTSHLGEMCPYEFAHIFGEVRELFGLHCIPDFQKEAGKKYILITNEANYSIFHPVQFGETIRVKMWIEERTKASFTLRAEYWSNGVLCSIAAQRIAYLSLLTNKLGLPDNLQKQIDLIKGRSSRIRSFFHRIITRTVAPIHFLWRQ